MDTSVITTRRRQRLGRAAGTVGALCLLAFAPARPSVAANPFSIDGIVPDGSATEYADKYGNVKELGPINSSATKVGVINTASVSMLGSTNPNAQVDLRRVWLESRKDADKNIWLYFGWERDSNSGSGFISLEAEQALPPSACDYTKTDAQLIASCNPWSGRQTGDFMILWDQGGGSTAISLRTFNGTSFGAGVTLDPTLAVAKYSADGYRGELALNLTAAVFGTEACTSIANILPGTVTGNSDSADYKDWIPLTAPTISSCGQVTIKKVTNPTGSTQDFSFSSTLSLIPGGAASPFTLKHGGSMSYTTVAEGLGYTVTEGNPSPNELTSIACTKNGTAFTGSTGTRTATFDVAAGDIIVCTYTNTGQGTIIVKKDTSAASRGGIFAFTSNTGLATTLTTSAGNNYIVSQTFNNMLAGTYDVDEPLLPAGWKLKTSSCTSGGPSSFALVPGGSVTCTFVNEPKLGAIKVHKQVKVPGATGMQGQSDVAFTISGGSLGSSQTVTTDADGNACLGNLVVSAMSGIGNYTVTETVPAGYVGEAPKTVTVTEGACASGAAAVTFTNTPLTDVKVEATAQVPGATKSAISCTDGSSTGLTPIDPAKLTITGLVPGTYTCTIVIDP